ncbi:MAG: hypothetical protein FP816_13150 [Desulfobacteraceae bacterium]|nr:hypothetical protein [Desulfobacteraceae bacterium]
MKPMNPKSARTLTFLSGALALSGGMILSPSGALFLLVAASICAIFPAVFGKKTVRIIAALLLIISISLAFTKVPEFKKDQETYRRHMNSTVKQ